MKRFHLTLLQKAVLLIIIVLIPIIITSVYWRYQSREYLTNHISTDVSIIAEAYEIQIYQFLDMMKDRVEDFSNDVVIQKYLKNSSKQDVKNKKNIINNYLKQIIILDRAITKIDIISDAGSVIASTDEKDLYKDISTSSYFLKGKTGASLDYRKLSDKEFTFVAAAPVIDIVSGETLGVVANHISLKKISKLLSGELIGDYKRISGNKLRNKNMEIFIVDENKMMLVDSLYANDSKLKQKIDTKPVREALSNGKEFVGFYKDYRGKDVIGAAKLMPSMRWVLLVKIDYMDAVKPFVVLRNTALSSIVITIGLMVFLLAVFNMFIVVPVRKISKAAVALSEGNYETTVPVMSDDEMGELSSSFNRMSNEIKNRTTILKNNESQLYSIIDNTAAVVYIKDLEGRYILVNRTMEKNLNMHRTEMLGKTDYDLFPDHIASNITANDRLVIEGNTSMEFEEIVNDERGTRNFLSVKVSLTDDTGKTYAVCGISTDITDRKKIENRLREAQSIGKIGSWEWNRKTNDFTCSEEVFRIFELPPEEAGYDVLMKYYHPEERDHIMDDIGGQLLKGNYYSVDYRILLPSGTVKYVNRRGLVEVNADGRLLKASGTIQDITEQKKIESMLYEAQRIGKIGSWEWNIATDEFICSDEALRIYGLQYDKTLSYNSIINLIHPEDLPAVYRAVQEAVDSSNKKLFSIDHRIILQDGSIRYVNRQGAIFTDDHGSPSKITGTVQDITDRKLAELKRFELQRKYENLVNSMPVGICRIAQNGYFVEANPAIIALFEADSKDEIFKYNKKNAFCNNKEFFEQIDKSFSTGKYVENMEVEFRTLKGKKFWGLFTAREFSDEKNVRHIDCIIQNITERKRLEEELRQSQKMEAIGRLSGGIAHDFNNILTAVIGYADMLMRKRQEDELTKTYTDRILTLCGRASSLTNGLLAFSRKQVMSLSAVNLNEIVEQDEKFLRRIIGEDISLEINLPEEDLLINADMNQIEQVLMNLTTNARDAMPDGGVISIHTKSIEIDEDFIRVHAYEKPGKYAYLCFSDTGIGIDEETQNKIYEPFYTTKEIGKGTGLGLSIVYGIVTQHEGFIDIVSMQGKGTTFNIYFPLVSQPKYSPTEEPEVMSLERGSETILLAEDEEAVRNVTKEILEENGYKVITAVSGEDAVLTYKRNMNKIDFIILDVIMPNKNGKEAYDEIKRINPEIKCLFISGYTGNLLQAKGIETEKINFAAKPLHPEKFLRKIRELIDAGQ